MDDFYSYQQEETEDGSYNYTFITNNQIIYAILFNVSEYSDHLNSFPTLLENGFSFSVFRIETVVGKDERKKFDHKISNTIFRIVSNHFKIAGSESVLLFYCDTADELQRCRHILFNKWYKESNLSEEFIKESLEVEILQDPPVKHYIGYLAKNNNPSLNLLQEEFNAFSMHMIGSKINPQE